jgi:tRNA uridine 5-carbamoylmethylation protein Kti12
MKHLFIFIGPPAGGKTTATYGLASRLKNTEVIEVDKIKEQISGSVFPKKDSERELWFQEVNKRIKEALQSKDNVIVDEGFFETKYLNKILIGVEDVPRTIVKIIFSLDDHLERDENRPGGGNIEAVTRNYNVFMEGNDDQIEPDIVIKDPNMPQEEIIEKIISETKDNQ